MAYLKNFAMGTLTLSDGTSPTALTFALDMDNGDIQITGLRPGLRESQPYERKGQFVSEAFTTRRYPTVTLTFQFEAFSLAAGGTIADWVFGDGAHSARVGTLTPSGATDSKVPFACDASLVVEGSDYGDSGDHTLSWDDWVITDFGFSEGDPNTFSISGEVRGAFGDDLVIAVAA
jgi:hypothetical protein